MVEGIIERQFNEDSFDWGELSIVGNVYSL